MLIIGERINTTRKEMGRAVEARDAEAVRADALKQAEGGAGMLDVNCGSLKAEEEPEALSWLVRVVQDATALPLCIDSASPAALAAALSAHHGKPMINSTSGEAARYGRVLPLVREYGASVVALCMDESGIPKDGQSAVEVGTRLVERLIGDGVPLDDIYFDPLVRSVATSQQAVVECLRLMGELGSRFPGLHFVSGLSNVSFGLPERRHLNRAFVVMSAASGLDAVIMDPLDASMVALVYATEALTGRDRFCLRYIEAYKKGRLKEGR